MSNLHEDITRPRFITPHDFDAADDVTGQYDVIPLTRSPKPKPIPHVYVVSERRRFGIPGMNGFTETYQPIAVFSDAVEAQSFVDGSSMPECCTVTTTPLVTG